MNIKNSAINRLSEINKAIEIAQKGIKSAPEGVLEICAPRNEYYMKIISKDGKKLKQYISKKQRELLSRLAQKGYYKKVLPALISEKEALEAFIANYNPMNKYEVYESLSMPRKNLIKPLFLSVDQKVKKWQAEEYEENNYFPEKKIYETDRGEMVRSKSELMIANYLNSCPDLDYRYEKPLYLQNEKFPIYPDFTIINLITGRITYHEHCGMMDMPKYANDYIVKEKKYVKAGMIPGRDVFFTYESDENPFDQKTIRQTIEIMRSL